MPRILNSAPLLLLLAAAGTAQHSPQCTQETETLQADSFLDLVQNDLYDSFQDDYNSVCDFKGVSVPDCGLKFDGNNRTYVAACEDKGGQVLTRPVVLKCGWRPRLRAKGHSGEAGVLHPRPHHELN